MTKTEHYELILSQMQALITPGIPAEGNIGNILGQLRLEKNLFWVGIYKRIGEDELGLSHFQGMPACTRIAWGKGVCGTAAQKGETVIVDDVTLFPGYIACHSEAQSEIVIPGFDKDGNVSFVLDVDSVDLAHFDETDKLYLEKMVRMLEELV